MKPGSHGSTFGGNPVCCAGALAVLDTMDEEFLANVNERAAQLRAGLAKLPHVQQVSGLGLMVGIAFDDGIKAADVRAACEKQGLLVLTAKTRLRLLPPLILTAEDVNAALDTLAHRAGEMRMKHLLKLGGLTPEEITHILDVADEYKRLHRDGIDPKDLQGQGRGADFRQKLHPHPRKPGSGHLPDGRPGHLPERQ